MAARAATDPGAGDRHPRWGSSASNWFSFYRAHERTRPPAVEAVVAALAFCALALPGLAVAGVTGFVVGRCAGVAVQLGVRARYVRALLPAVRVRDLLVRSCVPTAGAAAAVWRCAARCGAQAGRRPRRSPSSRSSAPSSSC
jgi:hypothetical protein